MYFYSTFDFEHHSKRNMEPFRYWRCLGENHPCHVSVLPTSSSTTLPAHCFTTIINKSTIGQQHRQHHHHIIWHCEISTLGPRVAGRGPPRSGKQRFWGRALVPDCELVVLPSNSFDTRLDQWSNIRLIVVAQSAEQLYKEQGNHEAVITWARLSQHRYDLSFLTNSFHNKQQQT